MAFGDDLLQQLLATFAVEAEEHVHAISRILLALERNRIWTVGGRCWPRSFERRTA